MTSFNAFKVFQDEGRVSGRVVELTLDDLPSAGASEVVIKASYSSVNFKDALAGTGAGKIMRRFPLVGGIDVAGTVASSADGRFREGDAVLVTGHDLGVAVDGGYSGYVRVPGDWVVRIPAPFSAFDVMAIGTAGFTAALSVLEMERNGLRPGSGAVVVTGATGGVGSVAVGLLAARKYEVTAITGKESEGPYLRSLGAKTIVARQSLEIGKKPLEKMLWAGAVDPVGGEMLAWLTRTMMYGGSIANSGLAGGTELHTTVLPFILRGVKLLGIDSVNCPAPARAEAWALLAKTLTPASLRGISREIGFAELPAAFETLLKGEARGRFVVRVSS